MTGHFNSSIKGSGEEEEERGYTPTRYHLRRAPNLSWATYHRLLFFAFKICNRCTYSLMSPTQLLKAKFWQPKVGCLTLLLTLPFFSLLHHWFNSFAEHTTMVRNLNRDFYAHPSLFWSPSRSYAIGLIPKCDVISKLHMPSELSQFFLSFSLNHWLGLGNWGLKGGESRFRSRPLSRGRQCGFNCGPSAASVLRKKNNDVQRRSDSPRAEDSSFLCFLCRWTVMNVRWIDSVELTQWRGFNAENIFG